MGLNFAAGMSGGVAYVYDEYETLEGRANRQLVRIGAPTADELVEIRQLIAEHVRATGSARGIKMLYRFEAMQRHFKKVIPVEYERVLGIVAQQEARGLTHGEALERAFETVTGRGE